jgi:hypothetical protein
MKMPPLSNFVDPVLDRRMSGSSQKSSTQSGKSSETRRVKELVRKSTKNIESPSAEQLKEADRLERKISTHSSMIQVYVKHLSGGNLLGEASGLKLFLRTHVKIIKSEDKEFIETTIKTLEKMAYDPQLRQEYAKSLAVYANYAAAGNRLWELRNQERRTGKKPSAKDLETAIEKANSAFNAYAAMAIKNKPAIEARYAESGKIAANAWKVFENNYKLDTSLQGKGEHGKYYKKSAALEDRTIDLGSPYDPPKNPNHDDQGNPIDWRNSDGSVAHPLPFNPDGDLPQTHSKPYSPHL